ncbi:MAG TPA: metallophosphatase family protein [Gammaproteobacteria bacterium]|nr:metallophosphatase family protein [Gammaproteobacteria bacterium]
MLKPDLDKRLPHYRGKKWIRSGLPSKGQVWSLGSPEPSQKIPSREKELTRAVAHSVQYAKWKWPKQTVYFFSDPHADAEAFVASLVVSGGVKKTGSANNDFRLVRAGRKASFIIGGDCLDKGPSNLQLLKSIETLGKRGARVQLLAGNHDMRLLMAMRTLHMKKDPRTEHFFVRMGAKAIPLLKEIYAHYLEGRNALRDIPGRQKCKQLLFPSNRWFDEFPHFAQWLMPENAVKREVSRLKRKADRFESLCDEAGLSMQMVYATAIKCRELFLEPKGEFYWFYNRMKLAKRIGSFLFVHAGLDDRVATLVRDKGAAYLNKLYRHQVHNNLFEFYYGPLANVMRTKYRDVDMPLTGYGVERVYEKGIQIIVHGHRNNTDGQRLMLRKGMLHIESDTTMDRNSRKKEGLEGYGVGVTIIRPEGQVIGISADYPYAKVFEPRGLVR